MASQVPSMNGVDRLLDVVAARGVGRADLAVSSTGPESRREQRQDQNLPATSATVQHAAMGETLVEGEADSSLPAGSLWLVATPIGNLADLSARAVDVLRRADRES